MANVSLSIWYQLHDGLESGQAAGADQSHFGLVRSATWRHPERGDARYWQPKRGFFAASTFTSVLAGRVPSAAARPVVVATAGAAKSANTSYLMAFARASNASNVYYHSVASNASNV